ncbi:APC family permease [Mycobacterium paraseoulense]|uniref:APC family permease n=1 Tax=Mycobacterium paraseoulense TaxID=590652 RepID=UPI001301DFCC|nr:APC family permease [Mycobacterium paraseoulense]
MRSGTLSATENVVIAVTSVAPAYSLAATLTALVALVGPKAPALFIIGFIPTMLTAFAFRELAKKAPDCGSTFTWTTRAFGPWVGWISGWALVIASMVGVGNGAQVATVYLLEALDLHSLAHSTATRIAVGGVAVAVFVVLVALRLPDNDGTQRHSTALLVIEAAVLVLLTVVALVMLSSHAQSVATQIAVGGVTVLVLVALCLRGIDGTQRYQAVLLAIELSMLLMVSGVALWKVITHDAGPQAVMPQVNWFLPRGLSASSIAGGTVLCVFAFWGWDASLSVSEETKEPRRNPGRAAVIATFILLLTYVLVSVALQAFAGFGSTGIGLRNPANANDTLAALGNPVIGTGLAVVLLLAISSSSVGAVLTYVAPTARTVLAMAVYGALPRRFALLHRQYQTPWLATLVIGLGGFAIYALMTLLSRNSLPDMVSSLALVTTFYYALTAYACVWIYRGDLRESAGTFLLRGVLPLLGALAMTWAFVWNAIDAYSPAYGKTHVGPVGGVFIMGVGLLVLGIPLALLCALRQRAFFRGKTLNDKTVFTDAATEPGSDSALGPLRRRQPTRANH